MAKPVSKLPLFMMIIATIVLCFVFSMGCAKPWPESPLYETPENDPEWSPPDSEAEAKAVMEGRYAHYDIVAYGPAETPMGPMNNFIISYGFTELRIEGGDLVEEDQFCHAAYKANQPFETVFDDVATQAIEPRVATVDVFEEDGAWKIWRPATPTLIGIDGDPDQPLSTDPNDSNINDPDNDGKPGVTVVMKIYGIIDAELYIARREIFQNDLILYSDGSLRGHVVDESEQLVIDATMAMLKTQVSPPQYDDYGLNPMMLIPIPDEIDTCEELMANRDVYFPPEPIFTY